MRKATVLEQVKCWRSDIRMIDAEAYCDRNKVAIRVHAWNWLTSPSRPMTDREHDICRKFAGIVWRQLQLMTGWHESDSGRLWI